jgi:hypothetical protein
MVELVNIIKFCNLLVIVCFFISSICNYISIGKNYNALLFIVNTFILLMGVLLGLAKIYPEKVDIDTNVFNSGIQVVCGIFMLGMSNISIGIGILCIMVALLNIFYVIFRHNITQDPIVSESTETNN